jgi:16S rRNA (guanine527-N7)-methyltransferase
MTTPSVQPDAPLNALLIAAGQELLTPALIAQFDSYLALLLRWNQRVNLTAIRDAQGILSRHFVESIATARALPTQIATLLDFGSGAGFPGLPIALCRPEIAVTLAESQGKKAAFLRETVRSLSLSTKIHSARAESLPMRFDCITLRAVDHMALAVQTASALVNPKGFLAPLTTNADLPALQSVAGAKFEWATPISLPGGDDRILAIARRSDT